MIDVVLGTNYGDEGKGQTTAFLTRESQKREGNPLIIKFSGGAQSGHTADGIVFHQYGSGLVETCLTRDFVFNPLLLRKEYDSLTEKGITPPMLHISGDCLVTTPFDMLANQIKETIRGENRYGSCGLGVWETVKKAQLRVSDIVKGFGDDDYRSKIFNTMIQSYNKILDALIVLEIPLPTEFLSLDAGLLWQDFWDTSVRFLLGDHCTVWESGKDTEYIEKLSEGRDIIFEGSQGLLLDTEESPLAMQYRTPTSVSSKNPVALIKALSRDDMVRTWYCTRTYFTKHGAGPFTTEGNFSYPDKTNKPNEWQGSIRFGYFDDVLFDKTVSNDRKFYKKMNNHCTVGYSITYGNKTKYEFNTPTKRKNKYCPGFNVILFKDETVDSGKLEMNYIGNIKDLAKKFKFI